MEGQVPLPRVSPEDIRAVDVERASDTNFSEKIWQEFLLEQPDIAKELLAIFALKKDINGVESEYRAAAFVYHAMKISQERRQASD